MKKTTKKAATKTPAPAKKSVAKPAAAAPVKPVKKAAAPKAKAPAIKAVAPAAVVTVIQASIDVGFGNSLYLRGEGPGLSWDKGVLLDCLGDSLWSITLAETSRPVVCKFLLNDVAWSIGNDYVVAPGTTVVLEPTF